MISSTVMVCNISVSSLFLISLRLLIGGADIAGITRHNESAQALYATNCGSQRHNIIICTSYFAFFFFSNSFPDEIRTGQPVPGSIVSLASLNLA